MYIYHKNMATKAQLCSVKNGGICGFLGRTSFVCFELWHLFLSSYMVLAHLKSTPMPFLSRRPMVLKPPRSSHWNCRGRFWLRPIRHGSRHGHIDFIRRLEKHTQDPRTHPARRHLTQCLSSQTNCATRTQSEF